MKSFKQFNEQGNHIYQKFILATKAGEDTWKLTGQDDDIKSAKYRLADIWTQGGAKDKAIIDARLAQKNKWKLYQVVNWDGKQGKKG